MLTVLEKKKIFHFFIDILYTDKFNTQTLRYDHSDTNAPQIANPVSIRKDKQQK